jgi:NDP-sugar pyrophosphorylase family protein
VSSLNLNTFFKEIPDNLKYLFEDTENPWTVLQGGLKDFFSSESRIDGIVSPQACLEGKGIVIEKGAKVEAYAYIKGPCYIGSGSEIRHGAYLRGHVYIGKNCVVGHSTEVKHSIFFNGAKAGHFNYVGDSILGSNVNLGAGTKIANLKITPGNVVLKINNESVDTKLRKFGAIIGDDTETGCNSVLNPGSLIAAKSKIFPLASVSGVYLKKSLIKN